MRATALVLSLVAVGCIGILADEPINPSADHKPWTSTTADPWIIRTTGCGFCSGDANVSEHGALVVYESGHVLWFGFGSGGGEEKVTAVDGLAEYVPTVEVVQAVSDSGRLAERHVKIHQIATSQLVGDDWVAIQDYLDTAIQEAEDPGEPNWDCVDCSGPHVELFGLKSLSATLHNSEHPDYGNMEDGDPWDRILEQLAVMEAWIEASAEA